ncbi:small ribosomal subunit protein mS31 [Chironomus tepperi]|uniref:small ribosomal subunit protein mS31 n=1 Tax=Chironomus tepperi TaxID=113505 RepID=UPI00391F8273
MLRIIQNLRLAPLTRRSVVNIRWYSDGESSDDEKKKRKFAKEKSNDALKRLNQLLESMPTSKPAEKVKVITAKNKRQEAKDEQKNPKVEEDPKDLKSITQTIARKIGGDVQKTESELLSALLGTSSDQKGNLSDIIGGLKIESDKPKKPMSKAQNVRNIIGKGKQQRDTSRAPRERSQKQTIVNLFGGKPLNIFTESAVVPDQLETWSKLEKREMKLTVTHPPRNYFEKMILWTEQGKVWKFPIDNEQGMDVEKNTDFTEHVLLETHLEGWCPTRGPIRHFMELVCVGLSKNCFLSAQEKRDHIMWYKEYFESKSDVLGDLLKLGLNEGDQPKQIESNV